MSEYAPGDLVKYIPVVANGDPKHPDCEVGVVTSITESTTVVFVRFRGVSSEACLGDNLVVLAKTSLVLKSRSEAEKTTYGSGEGFVSGLGLVRAWKFELTGEKRAPRKGEWYLSGAIPEAYCARADIEDVRHILKRVP